MLDRGRLLRRIGWIVALTATLGAAGCGASPDRSDRQENPGLDARLSHGSQRALEAGGVRWLAGPITAALGAHEGDPPARLTLDADAQRIARNALQGRAGGVVAFDTDSGHLRVVAAEHDFDPFRSTVAPGSTLKVLFAGAGLADGVITANSRLEGDEGPLPDIVNVGGERYGPLTVGEALVLSSNTAFVDLTERLGAERIERWLRRAGWGEKVAVELPPAARGTSTADVPSLRTEDGGYRDPDRFQGSTVAQLALLAAAVATDGTVPTLRFAGHGHGAARRAIWDREIAEQLRAMMRRSVLAGTGGTMLDRDIAIAAKTGTMPRDDGLTQASVIAVAPVNDPRIAVAVSLVAPPGETGGSAAGPVAKAVLRQLLDPRPDR